MPDSSKYSTITAKTALIATASIGLLWILVRQRARILSRFYGKNNPLRRNQIALIDNLDECQSIVDTLKDHCKTYKVLGFDCEWVSVGGTRRPVALLQLSSSKGLCALFRLCNLKQIPQGLRDLLEDDKVIKVGVGTQDDAFKLSFDYGVGVASTLDLRFLAVLTMQQPGGLANMAKSLLNVDMDKSWRTACSNWEAPVLNEKQLNYAADDALVAVRVFEKLIAIYEPRSFWKLPRNCFENAQEKLERILDIQYKESFANQLANLKIPNIRKIIPSVGKITKQKSIQTRSLCTRSKALYDNCLLQAPDGDLLCTIDAKKAQWYVDQNLAVVIVNQPLTVRLNFEPSARAVGDVGRYYQTPKENRCVVCGRDDALSRKNVVPREYRKYFPIVMKSHTSHDVLLLCTHCHQLSNIYDLRMRIQLAKQCKAPLAKGEVDAKYIQLPELKKVKSAARALLQNKSDLPTERRNELTQILKDYYQNAEITKELLNEASNINISRNNENYCHHGKKVVQIYQNELGGLCVLEKMWRQHFLDTMKPKYLPDLWNVEHNANRLEIRAKEGRVDKKDLHIAGLDTAHLGVSECKLESTSKMGNVYEYKINDSNRNR